MHIFVDASEEAYAAVAYFRVSVEGLIHCSLVSAKTRVALQKPMSIHRLELQAAVLGNRLAESTNKLIHIVKYYYVNHCICTMILKI